MTTSKKIRIIGYSVSTLNGWVFGSWGIAISQILVTEWFARKAEENEMIAAAFPYAVMALQARGELPWQKKALSEVAEKR